MDVGQRLVARRAHLAPFCRVDPVKQHLRLQSYYQLARQLYRQSETYFAEGAWDNAYVFLAKFIKLCSKVVTAHHDYELPRYRKEREWVRTLFGIGGISYGCLFDAILDGMEAEELEYLEYEQSLTEEKEQNGAARANDQTNVTALEAKLLAMRLAKKNPEQTKVQVPTEKEDSSASNPSTSVRPRINHSLETHQKPHLSAANDRKKLSPT
uniref:USP8 dimerisation domain-containing protein n=1 Tax=Phytophthora ramorum TaxID=164328 RepID=H3GCF0_PHYRM